MTITGYQAYKFSIVPVFIAILFHVAGAIGIIWGNAEWFISLTSLNLIIMFVLLIWTVPEINIKWFFFFILCYGTGFFSEMVGVNTGILFGSYHYGNILGIKISGVPLLIAINWFMVVYGAGQCVSLLQKKTGIHTHSIIRILSGAFLCTFFDWVMEPAAIRLGYWSWNDTTIPVLNYITWFVLSFLLLFAFEKFAFKTHVFAMYLFLIQMVFFLILR